MNTELLKFIIAGVFGLLTGYSLEKSLIIHRNFRLALAILAIWVLFIIRISL